MSIAKKMQSQVDFVRTMLARNNGDLQETLPQVLDNLQAEIEHVEELECFFVPDDKQADCLREGM